MADNRNTCHHETLISIRAFSTSWDVSQKIKPSSLIVSHILVHTGSLLIRQARVQLFSFALIVDLRDPEAVLAPNHTWH